MRLYIVHDSNITNVQKFCVVLLFNHSVALAPLLVLIRSHNKVLLFSLVDFQQITNIHNYFFTSICCQKVNFLRSYHSNTFFQTVRHFICFVSDSHCSNGTLFNKNSQVRCVCEQTNERSNKQISLEQKNHILNKNTLLFLNSIF